MPIGLSEGIIHVTTRAFYSYDAGSIPSEARADAYSRSDAYFGSMQRASTREACVAIDAEVDDLYESYRSGLGCVRGMRSAVAIEAAVVLGLYGLWQLSHLFR